MSTRSPSPASATCCSSCWLRPATGSWRSLTRGGTASGKGFAVLGYLLGSTPEPSLAVLAGIRHLKARFGAPVLVSPSRKSFLRTLTGRDIADVGPASLAAELYAAWHGVDYIRTHDVAALHDALTVVDAIADHCRSPHRTGR
ncbi:MAG: hypothetical protein GEV03_26685 [Streptosporangiales bacterium]|nr:hypothetical protein [Streptosporangiales bacterium]